MITHTGLSHDTPIDELARVIVQDINRPLRHIDSFSKLLGEECAGRLDDSARIYLEEISEYSRIAQLRLAGLLQYARLENASLNIEPFDAAEALNSALSLLSHEVELQQAQLTIHPLPKLIADKERITLLFYCLLSNALTFCDGTPITAISASHNTQGWNFYIRDRGIGIAPDQREHIFGIFRTAHHGYPGIGMGLALARRIVTLHGGHIGIEPQAVGIKAWFCLPDYTPPASLI